MFHTHQPYASALARLEDPRILPIGQTELGIMMVTGYDIEYDGPAFDPAEGERLAGVIGDKKVLMMASHGIATVGKSVAEAYDLLYYSERVAQVQLLAMSSGRPLQAPAAGCDRRRPSRSTARARNTVAVSLSLALRCVEADPRQAAARLQGLILTSPLPCSGRGGCADPRQDMEDPGDLPALIAPDARTLPQMLRRQSALHGDRRLIDIGGRVWTFADTLDMATRFGGTLQAAGIGRGDHVAVICGNRAELLQIYLGCGWIGAVTVPINVASRGAQLAHILSNSQAKLLVVQAEHAEALDTLDAVPASLRAVWLIGEAPVADRWPGVAGFPDPGEPVPEAPLGPGDTVAILYTSGTTGVSKGVCCPHAQYFWWGVNTARLLGVRGDDVLLTSLPLFHTNALNTFYQALLTGASLVVEPRFSASGFTPALMHHKATVTYLLGAMVPILLSRPPGELDRAHHVRIALAPGVPERFHPEFRDRFGIALLDGYGSTETNFVLGCAQSRQRGGAMGPAYRRVRCARCR